jgi:bifunctional DNA-binding transcriptional regulator/antitoxin component of YhaV-PrlF toxin-antitoxin module
MEVHRVRIESDGGFTVPQELLDTLEIMDGDVVSIEETINGIVLRKVKPDPHADPNQ